jgi:DNA end-binding protein Ku
LLPLCVAAAARLGSTGGVPGKPDAMPRSLWSGTISFGLVSVPVRLFTATASKELKFHFLDRRDMSPIGYDKVNKTTGEHVDAEDIIRGFELEKGRFVEVDEKDTDRLDLELTHAIDICEFVSIGEIDPLFFRKGYYLLPQDGAEKPYRLLLKALEETERVAIAKIVLRDKQHLACLRPGKNVLLLETMYYAGELQLPDDFPSPTLRDAEKKMATSLIENLTAKWSPGKFHDQYRNELLDLLVKKAEGATLPEPSSKAKPEAPDLMDALRRSVQATKASTPKRTKAPAPFAAKKTKARRTHAVRKAS